MKLIPSLSKCTLLISGWVLFLLSWFLPRSKGKSASATRWIITFGALYICTIGFLIERGDPLLFGHYVWCLSFVVVAATLNFTSSKD
jgi:uncharacterized membrane protein SirB2